MRQRSTTTPFVRGLAVVACVLVIAACSRDGRELRPAGPDQTASIAVTTTAAVDPPTETIEFSVAGPWRESEDIAVAHTCAGEGSPPPLEILGIPEGTAALAVHLVALDSPEQTLWLVVNLAADARVLADAVVPADAASIGVTDDARTYSAPCAAGGQRREYLLSVYALDSLLPVESVASGDPDVVLTGIEERAYDIAESVFTVTG